jgi:hypothetical protein
MIALLYSIPAAFAPSFKSKSRLEAENSVLRHRLIVLRCKVQVPGAGHEQRPLILGPVVSIFRSILKVIKII